ncbi:MAG: hypothetical protein H0X02_12460 [Nitrosomonas sp.]|nr:hypothetical protein [Nitrosomonas sp.]
MNMKTISLYVSILIMALFSFSAIAADSHLDQAIQHAEAAITSPDGKAVAQHAEEAKTHAKAAKNDKTDGKHMDEGIKCLDDAVKEGKAGNTDAAKKAARDAVNHFKQAAK